MKTTPAKNTKPEMTKDGSQADSGVARKLMIKAARMLEKAPSWVLFSHVKLDGDAIGSAAALFEAGLLRGKRVRWVGVDPIPYNYLFLPHVEKYVTQKKFKFDGKNDLYVFLDSSNEDRGVEGLKERSSKSVVLNIDHHEDNTMFGTLNCVEPEASSTCELLWRIMTEANWAITPAIAECLYTGAAADTGWFAFDKTASATHLMAAEFLDKGVDPSKIDSCARHNRSIEGMRLWGLAFLRIFRWGESSQFAMTWLTQRDFAITNAVYADTETLINQILMIRGVKFAVLLTEDDDAKKVKVSFRSKKGAISAVSVARTLGGGGHAKAAGALLTLAMPDAIQAVQDTAEKIYAEWVLAGR